MSSKILFISLCLVTTAYSAVISNLLNTCSRSDPQFNICVAKSAREVIDKLLNGDKELNIPTFNPFYIESIDFSPAPNLKFTFNEIYIHGADKLIIDNVIVDWKKRHIEFNYTFPEMKIKANYVVDGQILVLPFRGNGPCEITFKNLANYYYFDYDVIKRKGMDYITISKSALQFDPENIKYKFDNLFNGDRRLGDELNSFLNENWRDIDKEIGGAAREAMGAVVTSTITNLAKKVPYKQLFKP